MGKRWSLQQKVLEKMDSRMQKSETGPLSYTKHKSKSKWKKLKCETGDRKNPTGEPSM